MSSSKFDLSARIEAVTSKSNSPRNPARMRKLLLCTSAASFCLSLAGASAQQAITTPILTTVENFRDLAGIAEYVNGEYTNGTGFANTTSHGGVARTGVFYRSQQLYGLGSSPAELATISNLNIGLVVDLRTDSEWNTSVDASAKPDPSIGAREIHVNIYNTTYPPSTAWVTTTDDAKLYMKESYRDFVRVADERARFRDALLALANESDAALYHCSGGKDRTGWTSMILQTIAGVSTATIMNDYLATNHYMKPTIDAAIAAAPVAQQAIVAIMMGVQEDFLNAGLAEVASRYGSIQAYLIDGLGLTQEDIYVLRAKMVYYQSLPGQAGFVGNAAAGAAFMNALQNSPLSGHYTRFNYYLQSAIDAGTLGGVEAQIGGQVHADAAAFALRQPVVIEAALAPYTSGRDLGIGQVRLWLTGLGEYFQSDGNAGVAKSTERRAGTLAGATHRMSSEVSAYFGLGYSSGSVGSAGGNASVDTALAVVGGRYGLSTLDAGPYVAARANFGWVDYHGKRSLGSGLGIAEGDSHGALYSGRFDIGNVVRWEQFTVTPQIGLRVSHVSMAGFSERGSDLALTVDALGHTASSVVADLDIAFNSRRLARWTVTPSAAFGYELALDHPGVETVGRLYDYTVAQSSAYDSRHLLKAGMAVVAQQDAFMIKAGVNAARGNASSTGINAQMTLSYRF